MEDYTHAQRRTLVNIQMLAEEISAAHGRVEELYRDFSSEIEKARRLDLGVDEDDGFMPWIPMIPTPVRKQIPPGMAPVLPGQRSIDEEIHRRRQKKKDTVPRIRTMPGEGDPTGPAEPAAPAKPVPAAKPKRKPGRPPKTKTEPAAPPSSSSDPAKGGEPAKKAKPRKKRQWPICSVDGCDKRVYMPSGAKKTCYQHHLDAGGDKSPLAKLREKQKKERNTAKKDKAAKKEKKEEKAKE